MAEHQPPEEININVEKMVLTDELEENEERKEEEDFEYYQEMDYQAADNGAKSDDQGGRQVNNIAGNINKLQISGRDLIINNFSSKSSDDAPSQSDSSQEDDSDHG